MRPRDVILFVALYGLEGSTIVLTFALSRAGDRSLRAFAASRPGLAALIALLTFAISGATIAWQWRRSRARGSPRFAALVVAANMLTVVTALAVGEVAVRVLSTRVPYKTTVLGIILLPRSWEDEVARNRELLRQVELKGGAYIVYDDLMGWTVGRNRRSADGLSFSSVEGIRSPRPDMALADRRPAHRIALVGDSHTFSADVGYEDSWGHYLEQELGESVQVLNFGVPGYGVDQAYLRYKRDVRSWRPEVVIFGVFPHDLTRAMTVYSFVSFPEWVYPFAKPRFILDGERLVALGAPPLAPEAIFSKRSIMELPFVEYDRGFFPAEWQWHFYHRSMLFRLLISAYPHRGTLSAVSSDEAMEAVNSELLRSFVQVAHAEGSVPIVIYLPSRIDLFEGPNPLGRSTEFARRALRRADVDPVDLTRCVGQVTLPHRYVAERPHYSRRTNAVVARCLAPIVLDRLRDRMIRTRR